MTNPNYTLDISGTSYFNNDIYILGDISGNYGRKINLIFIL